MKTRIKDWNRGVKLYHEAYDNYQEFYKTLMDRQPKAYKSLERILDNGGSSWVGCKSVEEAKDLFLNGWEKPLEQLKVKVDRELRTLEQTRCNKSFNNVCGYMPIIPNALMRLPNAMIDMKRERVKSKVLRFMIMIDRSCGTDVDEIVESMSKQLAYISMLEKGGKYRCRLEVCFVAFGGLDNNGSKYSTSCSVLVKSENQLFDTKRLCYPIINPSMLRLLMFGWEESLPMPRDDYYVCGYGTSYEHWDRKSKDAFEKAINENNENVIFIDLKSDVEKVLKERGC